MRESANAITEKTIDNDAKTVVAINLCIKLKFLTNI